MHDDRDALEVSPFLSVSQTLLRPVDSALASCMRYKAALQTTRQLMAELRSIVAPFSVSNSNNDKEPSEESKSPYKINSIC